VRTTVDIPDGIYRELEVLAAQSGVSVRSLILKAVVSHFEPPAAPKRTRIGHPLVASSEPSAVSLSNCEVNDLLSP
jgi:metal-responsive CopG/Arc/MetJ family transcriptional regulator